TPSTIAPCRCTSAAKASSSRSLRKRCSSWSSVAVAASCAPASLRRCRHTLRSVVVAIGREPPHKPVSPPDSCRRSGKGYEFFRGEREREKGWGGRETTSRAPCPWQGACPEQREERKTVCGPLE